METPNPKLLALNRKGSPGEGLRVAMSGSGVQHSGTFRPDFAYRNHGQRKDSMHPFQHGPGRMSTVLVPARVPLLKGRIRVSRRVL